MHGEAESRFDEEKIEGKEARYGGEYGRSHTEEKGAADGGYEIDKDERS
jgi:hypothetical protein